MQEKVDLTSRKLQLLREQQAALINLKQRAENQLHDAKQAQQNLLIAEQQQQRAGSQQRSIKYDQEQPYPMTLFADDCQNVENHFDATIKELEERLNSLRDDQMLTGTENVEYLQDRLDGSNDLLQVLNGRDMQLTSEHLELREKLDELQAKKMQMDKLAQQLQNMGDGDENDEGDIGMI